MTARVEFVWLWTELYFVEFSPENSYEKDFIVIAATLADHVELKNCFSELMTAGSSRPPSVSCRFNTAIKFGK